MPAFRTIVMLCALWLWLLSPAAAAPRTAGSCSCYNCTGTAGSGPPEFKRDIVSNCAPMSASLDWISLESTALQKNLKSCWAVVHLEPRIHNEVKVGTSGLPELSDRGCVANAAYFVGWPDELAESSPYEPDRHPKDCAPDYLRVGAESKTMKAVAAKATDPQVRVAYLSGAELDAFKLP